MDYYIQPQQYKAPNFMATMQGFAGLAEMADRAEQAPVNLETAKANLESIQAQNAQRKLTDPVQLATSQKNLDILNQNYNQTEKMNPLRLQIAQSEKDQGDEALKLARMNNEIKQQAQFNLKSAIQELTENPSSKRAQNALLAFAAVDPAGAQAVETAIGKTTEQQRRLVFDANFNAFIGMKNGSPDAAAQAITQARDAALTSGQPDLAAKFDSDLGMIQKDPEGALTKFALISGSSPDHRQAMDQLTKTQTLPSQVQSAVKKYTDAADSAAKQGNTVGDLLRRWQEVPENEAGGVSKLMSLGRIATSNETPTDVLRKETEAAFNLERLKAFKEEVGSMGIRNLKEFETALAGKSDPYSKKEQVIDRLQKIGQFTQMEQAYQQANADWLTTFRGSSIATRDATVNGIQIPKGSNVQSFKKAIAAGMFPDAQAPAANTPVSVTMPNGKTGTIPRDQVEAFKKKYPDATFR